MRILKMFALCMTAAILSIVIIFILFSSPLQNLLVTTETIHLPGADPCIGLLGGVDTTRFTGLSLLGIITIILPLGIGLFVVTGLFYKLEK